MLSATHVHRCLGGTSIQKVEDIWGCHYTVGNRLIAQATNLEKFQKFLLKAIQLYRSRKKGRRILEGVCVDLLCVVTKGRRPCAEPAQRAREHREQAAPAKRTCEHREQAAPAKRARRDIH